MFYNIDMSFPTGWTSSQLRIDNSKVSGTTDLTNFPVLINDVALGTTGVGTAIWSSSQGQEINTNRFLNDANLQGYWRFESDGTDSSGNGNNLTAVGTPTHTTGRFNNGVDFEEASSQYYTISDGSQTGLDITGDLSVSVWIKLEQLPSVAGSETFSFFTKDPVNGADRGMFWDILFTNNKMRFGYEDDASDSTRAESNIAFTSSDVGKWIHTAVTVDVSSATINFFINGVNTGSTYTSQLATSIKNTTAPFDIGANYNNNSRKDFFDGMMDDFAIFDRLLTDAEIQEIYQGGADIRITTDSAGTNTVDHEIVTWDTTNEKGEIWAKLGTVQATADTDFYIWYDNGTATSASNGTAVWSNGFQAVYHMNNGGAAALDSTSNNYTVTAGTSVPAQADGQVGSAVDFEASNSQFMSIADGSVPNLEISTSQTWFAWFKTESLNAFQGIATKQNTTSKRLMINDNNTLNFFLQPTAVNGTTTVGTSDWYSVVGVYNSSGSAQYIYVNGTLEGSATGIGTAPSDTNGDFAIGIQKASNNVPFDGIIDEVYVTNDAKSQEWIQTYYNNTYDPATFILTAIDYTRAISDNLSITDVIYREADFNRTNTDNIVTTDTLIRTFDQSITIQDNIVIITDQVVTTAVNIIAIATDIVGIDDSILRQVDYSRNPQDTITLDDITDRSITYNRVLDNSVGITDTIFSGKFIYASVLDNISIADNVNIKSVTNDVDNPIIEFYQIDGITPTIYNITNG